MPSRPSPPLHLLPRSREKPTDRLQQRPAITRHEQPLAHEHIDPERHRHPRTTRQRPPSAGDNGAAVFHPAVDLDPDDHLAVQKKMRHRGLRWLQRHGHLDSAAVHTLDTPDHAGGWSVDASVTLPAWDRYYTSPVLMSWWIEKQTAQLLETRV